MHEPSGGELSRRIDQLERRVESGFNNLDNRLDTLVTEKTILAYLAARDAEVTGLREDVAELKQVDIDLRMEVSGVRAEVQSAKRFAWQVGVPVAALMLGIIGFVLSVAQTNIAT